MAEFEIFKPNQNLAPYALIPGQSRGRLHEEEGSKNRSEYQRDRDRIIHSGAFRRLKHKTQVFVHHVGDINNPEHLSKYYSAADVLIVPSRADNCPNATIEAMACGTPVIGYAVGGIPSQMPADWNGVVKHGDLRGLTERVDVFFKDRGKSAEHQLYFREYAKETWDPASIAKKYISIYRMSLTGTYSYGMSQAGK